MPDFLSGSTAPSPLDGLYADPSLIVHDGRYWLYPTTDGHPGWGSTSFSVFSSTDLRIWTDHGEILRLGVDVTWAHDRAWAPAVAIHDGRFFLYYTAGGGFIGVAHADRPDGPFVDLGRPLIADGEFPGITIDPSVFRDRDGQRYLLWGNRIAHAAPLGDDMTSIDRTRVNSWVPTGFREAITVHERDGVYYASWSENDTRDPEYRVRYATGPSLLGPWTDRGVLLEQDPARGYLATGHHSITPVPDADEWIMSSHRFALDQGNGYRREVVFDRLIHHLDGTLQVVREPSGLMLPLDDDHGSRPTGIPPEAARRTF